MERTRQFSIVIFASVVLAAGIAAAGIAAAIMLAQPAIAWADDQQQQTVQTHTIERTWIKAGKKLYRWDYNKRWEYYKQGSGIENGYLMICNKPFAATGMARNITNSNPNVLDFTYKRNSSEGDEDGEYYGTIKYTLKNYGTACVTYRDYSISPSTPGRVVTDVTENIRYAKYANPLKTFKIGKQNYAKNFKKQPYARIKSSKLKGKIKVVAKKGWKVVQIRKINENIESDDIDDQLRNGLAKCKVKNGSKININNTAKKIDDEKAYNIEVACYNTVENYYTSVILFPGTYVYDAVFG